MNFKLRHDRLLLTPIEKTKTEGGILLPDNNNDPWMYGLVEAVGPKIEDINIGDVVCFYKCDANRIEVEGRSYIHLRDGHIVGIQLSPKEE
jgi:co-chaperonin GroES (HSP10)